MSSKRYMEQFKVEAVRQETQWSHAVAEVASRLGVSQHSLYSWVKQFLQLADKRFGQQTHSASPLLPSPGV